ncbi:MAG: ATP-grasp domain-containing protein [Parasporobacterium sp.]|nr:ATP-grasp domain-containing protein [Parasporobacterium sp.]MBR3642628.1 ATP-grasp domain-containing protein [Parasporobacterium sp.]
MEDLRVLVTAAGNVYMPGTLACLKNNGERNIYLVGADMSDDSTILKMCDAAYQVPRGKDPSYADALLDICEKEKVDIVLPIMSVELNALSENKERFEDIGTQVSVSNIDSLRIANDKLKLFNFMKENGLPCADYYAVKSFEELKKSTELLGYPEKRVCVKATDGSGSRGFRILSKTASRFESFMNEKPTAAVITLDELSGILAEVEEFPELLVMEYLPGAEYSVDLLADNGKALVSCCRKSLRMENSIMLDAVIVDDPAVVKLCNDVTEKLGLDGNIGYDIRERSDGTPVIMECNPRLTSGVPFFMEAGVNLPYLCVKKLMGEKIPEAVPEYGKIIRRRWMEMSV